MRGIPEYDHHQTRAHRQFGFALPAGKAPRAYVRWTLVFHAFGGSYFAPDGTPQLDSAAGIKTLQFIAKYLQSVAPAGDLTWDYNEVLNSVLTAQSAQAVIWPGGLERFPIKVDRKSLSLCLLASNFIRSGDST